MFYLSLRNVSKKSRTADILISIEYAYLNIYASSHFKIITELVSRQAERLNLFIQSYDSTVFFQQSTLFALLHYAGHG